MLVKDLISKIVDSYQKIVINEYEGFKHTGRRWIIEPHSIDFTNIPKDIWNTEIREIVPYYDRISIEIEKQWNVKSIFRIGGRKMREKEIINMIDDRLSMAYKVLDGDDHSIIIKDRATGKEFEITVKEIIEWKAHFKTEKEENNMFKDIYSKYKTKVDAAVEDYINELQDEYRELSNEDCIEITDTYADEIVSINAVYSNFENAAEETARSLGFVNDMNEAYFDFGLFENSLRDNENYIELSSGVVIYITRWKYVSLGGVSYGHYKELVQR